MTTHTEAELRGDLELLNGVVAAAMGWKDDPEHPELFWIKPDGYYAHKWDNPGIEFATSLDACRTFETGLTEEEQDKYQGILMRIAHHRRRYVWQLEPQDHCIALCYLRNVITPTTPQ